MPTYPWGENWDDCYNKYFKKKTERILDEEDIVSEGEAKQAFHNRVLMPEVRNAIAKINAKRKQRLSNENHSFWHAYDAGDFDESISRSLTKMTRDRATETTGLGVIQTFPEGHPREGEPLDQKTLKKIAEGKLYGAQWFE